MTIENSNLSKLLVKDLAKKTICDGHLFLMSGQRKFYLMKPGVFVDPNFIKKHAINNHVFEFETVLNPEIKNKFKSLFKELKYLQFEKDLRLKCREIVSYFHEVHSAGEHFLSFTMACYEEFCQLPFEEQLRMHETDMHLYRKALYSSAFSIILGITTDFFPFMMLKDFYNLTFTLDIGLCESNYSYFVAEACNAENREPGSGKQYLVNERASEFEMEVYLNHPARSYEFLKASGILAYPELAEVTLYQHELADGTGFPRKILKGQISNWEAVVIFSNSLVEITPEYKFEKNVISYLLNFKNEKLKDLPVNRVYKKLCLAFDYFNHLKETGT
jgi:HD-GYP domain-containing protein (c-di-GMP phosphodiesterase class II)